MTPNNCRCGTRPKVVVEGFWFAQIECPQCRSSVSGSRWRWVLKVWQALTAIALLSACSWLEPMPPDMRQRQQDAFDAWCRATMGRCCLRVGDVPVFETTVARCTEVVGLKCIAYYDPKPEHIALALEAIPPENVYGVMLHEAGHACGAPHSDRPGDVMHPRTCGQTITRHDLQLWREASER